MLSGKIRILNFDNSLLCHNNLLSLFNPSIIDLTEIGPDARLWLNQKTENRIKNALSPTLKDAITFIGSGDFHHLSSLLIAQFKQPISVIVFDAHPDWDVMPPRTGCGSWITRILSYPNVEKVILLGVSSCDISTFNIQTGNLLSLQNNRLEIYPAMHRPTNVFFKKVPQNPSLNLKKGRFFTHIEWRQLKREKTEEFLNGIISRVPTKQVYLSLDKDCLEEAYSLTNWEAGELSLNELLTMLKLIKEKLDLIGFDIAGDYSNPEVSGILKTLCSRWDHPKDFSARGKSPTEIKTVNEKTNINILELMVE